MDKDVSGQSFSLEVLRRGDRAEFARLVEAYYPMIYRVALRLTGNAQDAEDILQETFIKAYRHLNSFEERSSLSTWLYRIATNEALMLMRKQMPGQVSIDEPVQTDEGEQEPMQVVDWCCLPEEEFMSAESQAELDQAVVKLPASLRAVFLLRDIEGLSTQETGEILNLSETAVKTRLSRARLRLRQELTHYFGERMKEGKRE
jgi:RNA polymerase sigma-70 factor (ECF subfamily)